MRKEIEESLNLVKKHLPSGFEEFLNLGLVKDGIYKKIEFSMRIFSISVLLSIRILNLAFPATMRTS